MRNDQIFTPAPIVSKMLDNVGYLGENIKSQTIFEPSFGGGAFLIQIVDRILVYANSKHFNNEQIIALLDNVYGVEIDRKWYDYTIKQLNQKLHEHNLHYNWPNLICGDTTKLNYQNQFDITIGNPPYIKCWDLSLDERKHVEDNFTFCHGNTDLYVIFFELGLNALKENGKLCYITPNSFMRNSSQCALRKYLTEKRYLQSITDYGTVSVFDKIATYTAITLLNKSGNVKKTKYTMMESIDKKCYETDVDITKLGEKPWSFPNKNDEKFLEKIAKRKVKLGDLCDIQYGLATNADKVYILDETTAETIEPEILRGVVKGSTLSSEQRIIFPYTFDNETNKHALIAEETLRTQYPNAYNHLLQNKQKLEARDIEKGAAWYQYGRSQGIQNSRHAKIILKHIVSSEDTMCSIALADTSTLVYSGMFIVVKDESDAADVMRALTSEEFCRYVKLVGKNMSGGYKSFNTKIVKSFGIERRKN